MFSAAADQCIGVRVQMGNGSAGSLCDWGGGERMKGSGGDDPVQGDWRASRPTFSLECM